jgi:ClpP class serine protease
MTPIDRFAHLSTRLFNVPLAIREDKAEIITAALAQRFGLSDFTRFNGESVRLPAGAFAFDDVASADGEPVGYEVATGIACISIEGTLVHKLGTLKPFCGMTGYDGIRQNFMMAEADKQVEAIILDIDSPGGEVAGCFDLVDMIYNYRGNKPVWAILTENAFSAAYAIASAADRVIVPRTGGVGSIGVIALHVDFSKALTTAGIAVTVMKYGARKDDCAEFAPLSDPARVRVQTDIDKMGALFDGIVARNRAATGLKAPTVKGYQAATFLGEAGVEAGLADEVMAPSDAVWALYDSVKGKRP